MVILVLDLISEMSDGDIFFFAEEEGGFILFSGLHHENTTDIYDDDVHRVQQKRTESLMFLFVTEFSNNKK